MPDTANMTPQMAKLDLLAPPRPVSDRERAGVAGLKSILNAEFEQTIELLLACRGGIVTTGMGKAGQIASKIASTLASTGTPAMFVNPAEAVHGDLGMIAREDLI